MPVGNTLDTGILFGRESELTSVWSFLAKESDKALKQRKADDG